MSKWVIYEPTKDSDGVDCYIKRGEIVHCQDCKYWVYNFNGCSRNPCTEPWYATDFCNYGQKGDENVETD